MKTSLVSLLSEKSFQKTLQSVICTPSVIERCGRIETWNNQDLKGFGWNRRDHFEVCDPHYKVNSVTILKWAVTALERMVSSLKSTITTLAFRRSAFFP